MGCVGGVSTHSEGGRGEDVAVQTRALLGGCKDRRHDGKRAHTPSSWFENRGITPPCKILDMHYGQSATLGQIFRYLEIHAEKAVERSKYCLTMGRARSLPKWVIVGWSVFLHRWMDLTPPIFSAKDSSVQIHGNAPVAGAKCFIHKYVQITHTHTHNTTHSLPCISRGGRTHNRYTVGKVDK